MKLYAGIKSPDVCYFGYSGKSLLKQKSFSIIGLQVDQEEERYKTKMDWH